MNILEILKVLSSMPPEAIKDGLVLVQEGVKLAEDVKAFADKYPQVLEAFKTLRG